MHPWPKTIRELRPVALFVLLAAAAGTRVVAPDLLADANLLGAARSVAAHELQVLQLLFLLALDVAREVFHV